MMGRVQNGSNSSSWLLGCVHVNGVKEELHSKGIR